MNLNGNIDLLKLSRAGTATIRGVKCLVIPIIENDLYVTEDESHKAKGCYLGLSVCERREVSDKGVTHYVKQRFSKEYRESHTEEEMGEKPYLGNMKPFNIERKNPAETVEAAIANTEEDDLPF